MENAIYIGLSRQMAMRRQMDVIANNLANMNTTAYKSERVMFEEYLMKPAFRQKFSFVQDYGILRDIAAGEITTTGNPLDIAIDGRGFLVVDTAEGQRYTRNGNLRIDAAGRLTTADGLPVLNDQGQPFQIDPGDGPLTIAKDGTVSNDTGILGRFNLVRFENEQKMQKVGSSLLSTDQPPEPAADTSLLQGMIEGSNVKPIVEMTSMIELMRNYQSTQRMIDTDHERITRSIDRLAKVA